MKNKYNVEVKSDDGQDDGFGNVKLPWKYLLRQIFVCVGVCTIFFVLGLSFGAPTVFIPQIRKEANSTDAISVNMESWLSSVHGYSALPWVIIIPILTQLIGRKIPFIIVCINTTAGYVVFYCSINTTQLLISEIMQGMLLASNMTLLIVIITEYTSPQYRGIFLSIESTTFFCGVWMANATGTFSHWKNIGIIAFVCCACSLTAFFWPESPSWLAMKGRFEECAAAHHWLKGYDELAKTELETLIKSQKKYLEAEAERRNRSWHRIKTAIETLKTRGFYIPLMLTLTIVSFYQFSGKLVCTMYAVVLIKQITEDESSAYIGMLILEGVSILGMQTGCVLTKYMKRRTMMFLFSVIGITFLYLISLYLFLIRLGVVIENKIISISLLAMFSVTISAGPLVIYGAIFGEIIFLRYKSSSLILITLYSEFLMATVLKMSPHMFEIFTLPGAFLFYGSMASIFIVILYKYLPETKDKTLQEIEDYFNKVSEPNDKL